MATIVQFVPGIITILWSPRKGIPASWRVLSPNGQLVEFRDGFWRKQADTLRSQVQASSLSAQSSAEFDFRLHANLKARFGDQQPENGTVSPMVGDPRWIDTYGMGNFHNSVHQFQPAITDRWNRPQPFPCLMEEIEARLCRARHRPGTKARFNVGLLSDPFQWLDCKYSVTKKLLLLANALNVQLTFHTMSDLCAHDDYRPLLKAGGHRIIMHLGVNDDKAERYLSPGAPSVLRRKKAVALLKASGISVTCKRAKRSDWQAEIDRRMGTTGHEAGLR